MNLPKCGGCAPNKIMETAVFGEKSHDSSPNLDQASYQFIWEYFTSRSEIPHQIPQKLNPRLYQRLSKFADLPFLGKKTSLYQLYLITKPTDLTDPNYHQLKSASIATLVTILWIKLNEYCHIWLGLKPNQTEEHQVKFLTIVKNRSLSDIETEVELLIDGFPNQQDWNQKLKLFLDLDLPTKCPKLNLRTILYSELSNLTYSWKIPAFSLSGETLDLKNNSQNLQPPSQNDDFQKIVNHSLPFLKSTNYNFSQSFRYKINRWILAEAVLRKFTWSQLRIMSLPNHQLLIKTLQLDQLAHIHRAGNLCQIVMVMDESPTWNTFLTDLGNILISRAVKELARCRELPNQSSIIQDATNLNQTQSITLDDHEKQLIRKWYDRDRNYALVALANSIQADGSVDICSLNIQIQARVNRGMLEILNQQITV